MTEYLQYNTTVCPVCGGKIKHPYTGNVTSEQIGEDLTTCQLIEVCDESGGSLGYHAICRNECRFKTAEGICSSPINTKQRLCAEIKPEWCYYKQLQKAKEDNSKLSDKVPQLIMRNKELEEENAELKKTLHQPDFLLALADISNGERNRRINLLSRYEQALRRICNKTRLMLSVHSKRIATNGELFSVITEANALSNEVLKWQKY